MSDEDKRWTDHCAPAFDRLHEDHQALVKRVTEIEIITRNGLVDKVKGVERMQWWLLGAIGGLGGLVVTLYLL